MQNIVAMLCVLFSLNTLALDVLIVGEFTPFGTGESARVNSSQVLLDKLDFSAGAYSSGVALYKCTLPVSFKRGYKKALDCLQDVKEGGHTVLGLLLFGESDQELRLEPFYSNSLAAIKDNDGQRPKRTWSLRAVPKLPKYNTLNFPYFAGWCGVMPELRERLVIGSKKTLGGFVCNYTALKLSQEVALEHFVGFIHVPSEVASTRQNELFTLAIVEQFIMGLTDYLMGPVASPLLPHIDHKIPPIGTTRTARKNFHKMLAREVIEHEGGPCFVEFFHRLAQSF